MTQNVNLPETEKKAEQNLEPILLKTKLLCIHWYLLLMSRKEARRLKTHTGLEARNSDQSQHSLR